MTKLERLHELMIDIIEDIDKEKNLAEFKRILKEEKENGLDLNDEITTRYCEEGDTYYYEGNLSKNWKEIVYSNWDGKRYSGEIGNDEIYSQTIFYWLTNWGNIDIARAIDEQYPDFIPEVKNSIFLRLKDVVDKNGFKCIQMLDNRYLVTNEEIDRVFDWLDEHEEEPDAILIFKTTDILEDEQVEFKIKADQRENFVNHQCDLEWCEIERA